MPAKQGKSPARLYLGLSGGLLLFLILLIASYAPAITRAAGLQDRSWQLANSAPHATTDYSTTFTISNNLTLGSISILLCSNSPLESDFCAVPSGLDVSNAQLTNQTGISDFNFFTPAPNYLLLSRTPAAVNAPLTVKLTFHNIINPDTAAPYYVRMAAYSSNNATGSSVAYGGLAFSITDNLQISSVVPPYLAFCSGLTISGFDCRTAAGDYINFGELSPTHSNQATSQLLVATNAANGYGVQVYGDSLTSGNNVIPALANGGASRPGTSQFGINLRANTAPAVGADPVGAGSGQPAADYGQPNQYRYVSNDTVVSTPAADDYRKFTVSYVVNVSAAQPIGVYASTLTYVAVGSF